MGLRRKSKKKVDPLTERIEETKKIKDDLVNSRKDILDDVLSSKRYTVDSIIFRSELSDEYHNLIDSEDEIEPDIEYDVNKTRHMVDVELYKLDEKLKDEGFIEDYKDNGNLKKIRERIRSTRVK